MQINWTEIPIPSGPIYYQFSVEMACLTYLVLARYDGDIVFQEKFQVRLKHLVELVSVGEENDRTA